MVACCLRRWSLSLFLYCPASLTYRYRLERVNTVHAASRLPRLPYHAPPSTFSHYHTALPTARILRATYRATPLPRAILQHTTATRCLYLRYHSPMLRPAYARSRNARAARAEPPVITTHWMVPLVIVNESR